MKKKILFVGKSLKVGGIERALIEQLKSINYDIYDVYLFLFSHSGSYMSEIPNNISLLPESRWLRYFGLTQNESKNSLQSFIVRNIFAIYVRLFGCDNLLKFVLKETLLTDSYDYAISYFQNGSLNSLYCGCNELVIDYVKANKKIAWIHSDYILGHLDNEYNNAMYKRFDAIVNVSQAMKFKFDNLKIVSKSKSFIVYNRYDSNNCLQKSLEVYDDLPNGRFSIITVGRLEHEKGIKQLFNIAKELKDLQYEYKWYFVGTGVLMSWCEKFIKFNCLQNNIVLLGQKSNPYPYIANAHLLVSGSLSETFGLSILESIMLNTPVVAYKYESISEIINDNSIVCNEYGDIKKNIIRLISNHDSYIELKSKTRMIQDYNQLNKFQFSQLLENA